MIKVFKKKKKIHVFMSDRIYWFVHIKGHKQTPNLFQGTSRMLFIPTFSSLFSALKIMANY